MVIFDLMEINFDFHSSIDCQFQDHARIWEGSSVDMWMPLRPFWKCIELFNVIAIGTTKMMYIICKFCIFMLRFRFTIFIQSQWDERKIRANAMQWNNAFTSTHIRIWLIYVFFSTIDAFYLFCETKEQNSCMEWTTVTTPIGSDFTAMHRHAYHTAYRMPCVSCARNLYRSFEFL